MLVIQRRIGLLFALFLLLLGIAAAKAIWLATVRADDLRGRALAQQVEDLEVPASRGTITDRHGTELAVSEEAVTVFANPFLISDPEGVAARVAPLIGKPQEEVLRALADREAGFVYLARKLEPRKGTAVEKLAIEGIGTQTEPNRRYPHGELAAQLIGSVGTDDYGLSGLEQAGEEELHGRDGRRQVVKDATGKPVSIVDSERAQAGEDLTLTIDSPLQERTESVLRAVGKTFNPKGATALALDPRSGEILALANWPPVDANDIGSAPAEARVNRAVEGSYEPGSTFKVVTISGALEERLIEPETVLHLPSELQVADRTIGEAHPRGPVSLTVADILAQSSNVGSVMIGLDLEAERFDRWVRRFGFGTATSLGLPGEAPGIVMRPENYTGPSLGNMAIGQGIAVTPVQMAAAYSAVANGGVLHPPHVVKGAGAPPRRILSTETADQVSTMLEGVLGPGGTAAVASVAGYRVAGKTGTAEKPDGQGGYSETARFASFIGFAPARDPRILVAVMVDEPQGLTQGAEVAAPAFEEIVRFALPYMRIPPGDAPEVE